MAADELTAIVAGGGIAGLAAAVALAQAGWRVTVLERAPGFGEVGAGLGLTINGMAAAGALGLGDAVRAAGHRTITAGFQDVSGRWIVHEPAPRDGRDTVITIWGQHRQRLHAVLHQAATADPGTDLVTGAEVTSVRPGTPDGDRAEVSWRSGPATQETQTARADLVVAADGVRSAVRTQLFPSVHPVYGGSTSWRAVIPEPAPADQFTAVFEGRGCHGAFPHLGVDPITAACEAVINLQQFVSREMDPTEPAVVTVGQINAGTAVNSPVPTSTSGGSTTPVGPPPSVFAVVATH